MASKSNPAADASRAPERTASTIKAVVDAIKLGSPRSHKAAARSQTVKAITTA